MVGLVAQDGAAGMVGDDCGDAHQAQADRPGLPGAGGGVGQGEQLGEGQQACGPGPRSGTRYGSGRTPARESGQARCPWRSGYGPLAAGSQPVAHLEIGELPHPRAGGEGSQPVAPDVLEAQLGSLVGRSRRMITRIPLGQAVRSSRSVISATSAPCLGCPSAL